ncbi:MAG: thiol:disulfide interchange protein DsbC [Flavobacteriales bacterium]|jgi:thiol:disulfide interchange protein DsbC
MKQPLITALALVCISQICSANSADEQIRALFDGQPVDISEYNTHFKEVKHGATSYFATQDGRYVFAGPIIDTKSRTDIVEKRSRERRTEVLAALPKDQYLSYPAKTDQKHTITVFTDIDCPYCRTMHAHIDEFNAKGITVNYVMLPRAGLNSPSFDKTVSALCANEPAQAMTLAMNGVELPTTTCTHSAREQYQLAQQLKITSTPAIVLPNGQLKIGFRTPEQLLSLLEQI